MRFRLYLGFLLALVYASAQRSKPLAFDVASVKPSQRQAGPDYNNRITISPSGFTARNATLKRLIAEAYRLQTSQVLGPGWLDRNEYDIEARASQPVDLEKLELMMRTMLADRFQLKLHNHSTEGRVYELRAEQAGPKIRPNTGPAGAPATGGMHFRGDMRHFADFLSTQLSIPVLDDPAQPGRAGGPAIPVLDKTGLTGIYDFPIDIRPELGTDSFTQWQRVLRNQFGLRLEGRRGQFEMLVVDAAATIPTPN